jgi:hypothetical protein
MGVKHQLTRPTRRLCSDHEPTAGPRGSPQVCAVPFLALSTDTCRPSSTVRADLTQTVPWTQPFP